MCVLPPLLPTGEPPGDPAEAPSNCPVCGKPAQTQARQRRLNRIGCHCRGCGVFWFAPRRPVVKSRSTCNTPGNEMSPGGRQAPEALVSVPALATPTGSSDALCRKDVYGESTS